MSRRVVAAVLSFAGVVACSGPARAPQTHQIVIDSLAFGPAPTEAHVGDRVLWVNRDMFQHSATAKDGSFDVDLPPGASGSAVLTRAGTIQYYCRYHPGMTGRLEVSS